MFKRSIQKVSDFPSTRTSDSATLKRVLLSIGARAHTSSLTAEEAKIVCEKFLEQFETVVKQPVQKYTKTALRKLSAADVDDIAVPLGVSTDGNKEETIDLILAATSED